MKKRVLQCTFICTLIFRIGVSQTTSEETKKQNIVSEVKENPPLKGIILGVHGARETMFEIGYFHYFWEGYSGKSHLGRGYAVSTEHYINKDYIIAPKIAGFSNVWGINTGISIPWYFDMEKNNSLRVRPEIGFGAHNYKITYAFNMAITNKDMPNVSKHMVSAVYFLNFNKASRKKKL